MKCILLPACLCYRYTDRTGTLLEGSTGKRIHFPCKYHTSQQFIISLIYINYLALTRKGMHES